MRKVRRRYTKKRTTSREHPNVDQDIRTLRARVAALKPGDSLYPYALTKMTLNAKGKARWVAK